MAVRIYVPRETLVIRAALQVARLLDDDLQVILGEPPSVRPWVALDLGAWPELAWLPPTQAVQELRLRNNWRNPVLAFAPGLRERLEDRATLFVVEPRALLRAIQEAAPDPLGERELADIAVGPGLRAAGQIQHQINKHLYPQAAELVLQHRRVLERLASAPGDFDAERVARLLRGESVGVLEASAALDALIAPFLR